MNAVSIIRHLVLLTAVAAASAAQARKPEPAELDRCITKAAKQFEIAELPLRILLEVEGGELGKVSHNRNGSYDIGPFQINSSWLPRLAKLGISEHELTNNLCVNAAVAAWIFASEYRRHRHVGKAIAHYHSPTPKHQQRYLGLVERAIQRHLRRLEKAGPDTPTPAARPAAADPATEAVAAAPK
jgi:hypothetical protein